MAMQVLLQLVIFNRGSHTCCKPCKLILTIVYDAGLAGYTLFAGRGGKLAVLNHTRLEGMGLEDCCGGIILRSLALPPFYLHDHVREKCQLLVSFPLARLKRDVRLSIPFCVSTWNKFLETRFPKYFPLIDIYIAPFVMEFHSIFCE